MSPQRDDQAVVEARDFLEWLDQQGVQVWADWGTKELVFSRRVPEAILEEARRLASYLAPLTPPHVQATLNPYYRSAN